MSETIDLIALRKAKKELAAYQKDTEQPMRLEKLDLDPIRQVQKIEIGEEFITLTYNEVTKYNYNTKEITHRVWDFKYNNDPEIVRAIGHVIDLARKHLRELPENAACPPGCAQCCSGYEPFVSHADMQRIGDYLGMSKSQAIENYVVERPSADGFIVGYLRKVTDDLADKCVFLKGKESGQHYCGIYEARPHDCDAFTPINCQDVDWTLPRDAPQPTGSPFRPRHPRVTNPKPGRVTE